MKKERLEGTRDYTYGPDKAYNITARKGREVPELNSASEAEAIRWYLVLWKKTKSRELGGRQGWVDETVALLMQMTVNSDEQAIIDLSSAGYRVR